MPDVFWNQISVYSATLTKCNDYPLLLAIWRASSKLWYLTSCIINRYKLFSMSNIFPSIGINWWQIVIVQFKNVWIHWSKKSLLSYVFFLDYFFSSEKPLSLYVFSKNQKTVDKVISKTSSGGLCANDTLIYASGT